MASSLVRPYAHGTWQKYRYEDCRCTECREVTNARRRTRTRRKAHQQWGAAPSQVDAEPVRQHVRDLMAQGVAAKRIAGLAGVSTSTVKQLLYGCPALGRPPTQWMRPETARSLLAVTPGNGTYVDPTGLRRRLQALVANGNSGSELMRRLGKDPKNFGHLLSAPRVRADLDRAVRRLYDELWDVAPPTETVQDRRVATRARTHAQQHGWLPPLAWDDDEIDVPEPAVKS